MRSLLSHIHPGWFALVIILCTAALLAAGILDGTAWTITVIPEKSAADSGAKEFSDTIAFADGKFLSAAFGAKGFKPAAYKGETEEHEAEFEVEQVSESSGVANWLGEVRNDRIAGRVQLKKKDGASLSFNFSGTKDLRK